MWRRSVLKGRTTVSDIVSRRPRPAAVMGVVNVTPDSFSGDGLYLDEDAAVERGVNMFDAGAEIVDIGGESTRPYAEPVSEQEEMARVIGVVSRLAAFYPEKLSVDTMKPAVAAAALEAGAAIVNDVSGLRNADMRSVVAEHGASVIIMHMLGEPKTMQDSPRYDDVVAEIVDHLNERITVAEREGIDPRRIMVDPGIGFGKTVEHNVEILSRLGEFRSLGKPVVVGVSRKSFIGKMTDRPTDDRLGGSIAAAIVAAANGADLLRVHDVPETVQALRVAWRLSAQSSAR
ncbi:MAG: dihydropteroate synthase [Methanobacteriota archaeon]|nr:MAG: dihydropteroate synthase [Euryarchaeota archaeon]